MFGPLLFLRCYKCWHWPDQTISPVICYKLWFLEHSLTSSVFTSCHLLFIQKNSNGHVRHDMWKRTWLGFLVLNYTSICPWNTQWQNLTLTLHFKSIHFFSAFPSACMTAAYKEIGKIKIEQVLFCLVFWCGDLSISLCPEPYFSLTAIANNRCQGYKLIGFEKVQCTRKLKNVEYVSSPELKYWKYYMVYVTDRNPMFLQANYCNN